VTENHLLFIDRHIGVNV